MEELKLLTDQALGEGLDDRSDGLGFDTYANVLASAALGTTGPFTIGVFGEWGTGKTSLMQLMRDKLNQEGNVVAIWFNAWRYEKEEHPIVPLVGTIIKGLEAYKTFDTHLKNQRGALIRALRAIAYGFSAKSKVKVPGFAEIEASFVAKDIINREENLTPDPLLDRSLYYQAFESLSSATISASSNKSVVTKVVVFIDDLDRCFPDVAIRLLESIKLVLSQPGFIFVIGVSNIVIEGYLQHRYEKEYGIADFKGHAYLDKIVQLPFHIPSHNGRVKSFSDQLLTQLPFEINEQLTEILPIIAKAMDSNPRSLIRLINNILIDLTISSHLSQQGDIEPIEIQYFAIARTLQTKWPKIYRFLINSEDLCKWLIEKNIDVNKMIPTASSDSEEIAFYDLISSKKDCFSLLKSSHGINWLKSPTIRSNTASFLLIQRDENKELDIELRDCQIHLYLKSLLEEKISHIFHKSIDRLKHITSSEIGDNVSVHCRLNTGEINSINRFFIYCIGENQINSEWLKNNVKNYISKISAFSIDHHSFWKNVKASNVILVLSPGIYEKVCKEKYFNDYVSQLSFIKDRDSSHRIDLNEAFDLSSNSSYIKAIDSSHIPTESIFEGISHYINSALKL